MEIYVLLFILLTLEIREVEENAEDSDSSEDKESEEDEEESSEEEEEEKPAHSYAALMQILRTENGPQAKRRKLNTSETPKFEESEKEDSLQEGIDVDHVDEPEEGTETEVDGLLEDEDDVEDATDPFEAHFANPHENSLASKLKSLQQNQWSTQNSVIPKLGKVSKHLPGESSTDSRAKVTEAKDLKLKQKLEKVFLKDKHSFSPTEKIVADAIFNYEDMLFCGRTSTNAEELRRLTCLHAVNHVFK